MNEQKDDFYTYNNVKYHLTFSPKWAMCHILAQTI